jgi:hypothetical protein
MNIQNNLKIEKISKTLNSINTIELGDIKIGKIQFILRHIPGMEKIRFESYVYNNGKILKHGGGRIKRPDLFFSEEDKINAIINELTEWAKREYGIEVAMSIDRAGELKRRFLLTEDLLNDIYEERIIF